MIYSREHNALVYEHAHPAQVCAAIVEARALDERHVVVPLTRSSIEGLHRLGLPLPNMLDLDGYDWPMQHGRRPYAHQKVMANFMALNPSCFNLSDMGTGKTLASLWAADWLMKKGAVRRCLIISPLSTLRFVWEDELTRNFYGRRTCSVLYGSREQRIEALTKPADFYVVNHDGLGIGTTRAGPRGPLVLGELAQTIWDRDDIDLVIIDEASYYKSHTAKRSKIAYMVTRGKRVWQLSGTPTPHAPTDAYALARIAGRMEATPFRYFQDATMLKVSTFKWVPRRNAAEVVAAALQPAVRYSRDECLDLPECVVVNRRATLTDDQAEAMRQLRRELEVTLDSGATITAVHEASLRTKLLQIVAGAVYNDDREVSKVDVAPRFAVLDEIIEEAAGKVIVFAAFTSVVKMLAKELAAEHGSDVVAMIHGGVAAGQRNKTFTDFEDPKSPLRIIVADPGTMSHGLTLVAGNTIVWWTPTDNWGTYEQANARINRPGQTRTTLIARIMSTDIERSIYDRLAGKATLQGTILELAQKEGSNG